MKKEYLCVDMIGYCEHLMKHLFKVDLCTKVLLILVDLRRVVEFLDLRS